jgi:hypothetical protein
MQEDNKLKSVPEKVAFRPDRSSAPQKPVTVPKAPTSTPNPRSFPSRGRIIWEIFRSILDAGPTAPAWQDQPNPVTGRPNLSKKDFELWSLANREQAQGIRDNVTRDKLDGATNPEKNGRGCFLFNVPLYSQSSSQTIAVEAISGKAASQIVVDPKGKIAAFDARVSKTIVGEVDTSLPETEYSEINSVSTVKRREGIANRCGLKLKIYSTDQQVVNKATREGFVAQKLNMGGAYGVVRGQLKEGQVHHIPAKSVSPLSRHYGRDDRFDDPGPSIWMRIEDHKDTASYGRSDKARIYRDRQDQLIKAGRFKDAFQMDIDDIRSVFPDGRYEPSIRQALEHLNNLEKRGLLTASNSQLSVKEIASTSAEPNSYLPNVDLQLKERYPEAVTSNKEQPKEAEKPTNPQLAEPPNNQDWAKFTAAARALTAKLSAYDINTSASLLEKQLTTPQDYAQMLALSVGANMGNRRYADHTSPFTIQKLGSTINIFSNDSKVATINSDRISIARVMTESEKKSLEKHQSSILSSIQAQVPDSPTPKNQRELSR